MGEAVDALRSILGRDRAAHLVAIWPDGELEGISFGANDDAAIAAWIESRNGRAGLYYHINELHGAPASGRARKADVVHGVFAALDIDPPPAVVDPGKWKSRKVNDLEGDACPPSFIVDSGNGIHAYWRLEPALDLEVDPEAGERLEALNKALQAKFGGDKGTWSRDRIFRIPGTVNVPDARKRGKGREPVDTELSVISGYVYPVETLEKRFVASVAGEETDRGAKGAKEANGHANGVYGGENGSGEGIGDVDAALVWKELPGHVKRRIEDPPVSAAKGRVDRSEEAHWASMRMFELGWSIAEVYAVLRERSGPACEKYGSRLHGEIERSWWKWQQGGARRDEGPDFGAGAFRSEIDLSAQVERNVRNAGQAGCGVDVGGQDRSADIERTAGELATSWLDIKLVLNNNYVIRDVLFRNSASILFGPHGSGKSFLVDDLAWHIVTATPWRGRRIKPCSVLIIALEAQEQHERSLIHLRSREGSSRTNYDIRLYKGDFSLMDTESVDGLIAYLKERFDDCGVVFADNLKRIAYPGSINEPKDVGAAIKSMDRIYQETGVHFCMIHHPPRTDSTRTAGLGDWDQGVSTTICADRERGEDTTYVQLQKQRLAPDYTDLCSFHLSEVVLGHDHEHDEPVTIVEVDYTDEVPKPRGRPKAASDAFMAAVDKAFEVAAVDRFHQFEGNLVGDGRGVALSVVCEIFKEARQDDGPGSGKRKKDAWRRALKSARDDYRLKIMPAEGAGEDDEEYVVRL